MVDLEAGALTLTEAIERRNQLAERENQALKGISVRTTRKNYENASKALETDERVFNEPASEAKDRQD